MTTIRRSTRRPWISGSLLVAGLFLAAAAYVFVQRQEVWLTVPEALRGARVYADGSFVARVEDPSLTYFGFWRQRRVLEVRHTSFRVVRISLAQGRSYPAVSEAALIAVASIPPASPTTPASPPPSATEVSH